MQPQSEYSRVFLDTNVLIYAYSSTEPEKKEKVLAILENENVFLSTQVINEFIWVMNRKYDIPLSSLEIITNSLFELYGMAFIGKQTINKAIGFSKDLKYSYWDSLMLAAALEADCGILYSEDMQHGQNIEDRLEIRTPFLYS